MKTCIRSLWIWPTLMVFVALVPSCDKKADEMKQTASSSTPLPKSAPTLSNPSSDPFAVSPVPASAMKEQGQQTDEASLAASLKVTTPVAQKLIEQKKIISSILMGISKGKDHDSQALQLATDASREVGRTKLPDGRTARQFFEALFPDGNVTEQAMNDFRDLALLGVDPSQYVKVQLLLDLPSELAEVRPDLLQKLLSQSLSNPEASIADVALYFGVLTAIMDHSPNLNETDSATWSTLTPTWLALTQSRNVIGQTLGIKLARYVSQDKSKLAEVYSEGLNSQIRTLQLAALDELRSTRPPGAHEMVTAFAQRMRSEGDATAEARANDVAARLVP